MSKFVKVQHFVCRHSKNESKVKVLNVYSRNELLVECMKIIEGWKGMPFLMVNPFVWKYVLALAMYLISSFKKKENRVSNGISVIEV